MITRAELTAYLDDFLAVSMIQDYAPNGLQIEGRSNIKKICTAVTASSLAVEEACLRGADALLVHHGYFWKNEAPTLCGIKRKRVELFLKHDLNLLAYHLPLDVHPTLGNNACFARILDVTDVHTHNVGKIPGLLMSGMLKKPVMIDELVTRLTGELKRKPLVLGSLSKPLSRIAWCTGAAQDFIEQAADLGVDAYLSGEVSLRTYYDVLELNLPYLACGHHATEQFGIALLGEHLHKKFGLEHEFIVCDNPI